MAALAAAGGALARRCDLRPCQPSGWVVKDLDAVTRAWRTFGVSNIQDAGVLDIPMTQQGQAAHRQGPASDGAARIAGHSLDSAARWTRRVYVVPRVAWRGRPPRRLRRAHPASASTRRCALSPLPASASPRKEPSRRRPALRGSRIWIRRPPAVASPWSWSTIPRLPAVLLQPASTNEDPFNRITQLAFVVRDIKAVSDYWARVGLGGISFDRNVSLDRVYRGQPGRFEMLLGFNSKQRRAVRVDSAAGRPERLRGVRRRAPRGPPPSRASTSPTSTPRSRDSDSAA